jgi:hypothetical protein
MWVDARMQFEYVADDHPMIAHLDDLPRLALVKISERLRLSI